ncbi:hypothetical protein H6758_00210 [Candidatus Nomurabacteria bacterium]|nr:hypothetical protein [Candidatus Nomurabacteria bacterium]
MFIVTSGKKFVDIDALACVYAYSMLLKLMEIRAIPVITAMPNQSVISRFRVQNLYTTQLPPDAISNDAQFVVMDVSDPAFFDSIVEIDKVTNVFDHHPGFEAFWKDRIGDGAVIEPIGAAATLIFEEYVKNDAVEKMDRLTAELLYLAIVSNTLNFGASVTSGRDKNACMKLKTLFSFTDDLAKEYFEEVDKVVYTNTSLALQNDTKIIPFGGGIVGIAQLELWNSMDLQNGKFEIIESFLSQLSADYAFLNLIEISKSRNTLVCANEQTAQWLVSFMGNLKRESATILRSSSLLLRKQILSSIYDKFGR